MMLGPYGFEAIGFGYEGVSRNVNTQWADVPVAQSLNQQQWTGPTSEEVTIKGVLFPVAYGGQGSMDGIIAAANAGTPLMLVSGFARNGTIHGMFTIQGVQEDRSYINANGKARKNSYTITLKRYAGEFSFGSMFGAVVSLFR